MFEATFRTGSAEVAVRVDEPMSLMHAAVKNDVPGIIGECGGNAMCATCHVYVDDAHLSRLPAMEDDEDEMLDGVVAMRTGNSRLGCQLVLDAELTGIRVEVPGVTE